MQKKSTPQDANYRGWLEPFFSARWIPKRYPWQWNPPEVKPTMNRTVPQIFGGFRFPNLKKNHRLGEVPCVFFVGMVFSPKVSGTQNGGFPVPEISLFWVVGVPLDKPYPYSLHRFLYLHSRYLKFFGDLWTSRVKCLETNSGRCWCPHDVVQILSVGVSGRVLCLDPLAAPCMAYPILPDGLVQPPPSYFLRYPEHKVFIRRGHGVWRLKQYTLMGFPEEIACLANGLLLNTVVPRPIRPAISVALGFWHSRNSWLAKNGIH